jgi:hypothetical protein
MEGASKLADTGQNGGAEGAKWPDGVAFAFATVGAGAALVAGVEEAAEFFGLGQPAIHFVQEEGGLVLMDKAEKDRGGKVFRAEGAGRESGDEIESGGLAAAELWRGDVQARTLDESGKTVGVRGPESESLGRAGWKNEIIAEALGDPGQHFSGFNRVRPWLGRAEGGEGGLQHGIFDKLVTSAADLGVKGFDADAELAC